MPVTFDGPNLRVILPAATSTIDVGRDLYSASKSWLKSGENIGLYPPVFDTSGGRPTVPGEAEGRNYFLRNDLGWRLRPAEEDAEVDFVGNLFAADVSLPLFVPTVGNFTVLTRVNRSSLSTVLETGVSGLTVTESSQLSAIHGEVSDIEGGYGLKQWIRLIGAAVVNRLTGAAGSTVRVRDLADSKDRITAAVSGDGRGQPTLDPN